MAARKKTTPRKKSTTRRKSPARSTRTSAKTTRKTSSRVKTTRKAPVRSSKPPIQTGISLDRKLDIVGVALAVGGLLAILSLLSSNQGSLTGSLVALMRRALGWGSWFFPVVLILVGLWLVLRNFERVPRLALERLLGILLLFGNLLVWLHTLLFPANAEAAYALAAAGEGGGYIGAGLMVFLQNGLGDLGLAIALIAWFLIALTLVLDVSVVDLFRWLPPLVLRIQDSWDEWRARRSPKPPAISSGVPLSSGDTPPIPEPPSNFEGTGAAQPGNVKLGVPGDAISPLRAAMMVETRDWALPEVATMLDEGVEVSFNDEHDRSLARVIEETLASFGAPANVVEINRGPTITQFGVEPDFIETRNGRTRVRVGKIASLADDLSLALAASRIRVQAPVPGKGYVGIEVPNDEIAVVALRDVLESDAFRRLKSNLRFALGQDVAGHAVSADLAGMPHLLVAGATGSGKSVCVNAIIAGLLIYNTPATLRLIMVDPKRVELTGYNGIPHLLAPVVTEIDRVVGVLQWVTREMDSRYQKFADVGARNLQDYNQRMTQQGLAPMPYLVLIIDELADMMMVAPDQTEKHITRMAQLARATGIHLLISTQRPSVDVVTGLIKANFPARISFAVASGTDSRVILDQPGAERLLGRGDMLFQAPDAPAPVRLQGVFVSDTEIQRIVQYWRGFAGTTQTAPVATSTPVDAPPSHVPLKQMEIWEEMKEMEAVEDQDELFTEAVEIVRKENRASISMLQRALRIGYTRAARLVDTMEDRGIIGPAPGGSNAREVIDMGDDDLGS